MVGGVGGRGGARVGAQGGSARRHERDPDPVAAHTHRPRTGRPEAAAPPEGGRVGRAGGGGCSCCALSGLSGEWRTGVTVADPGEAVGRGARAFAKRNDCRAEGRGAGALWVPRRARWGREGGRVAWEGMQLELWIERGAKAIGKEGKS